MQELRASKCGLRSNAFEGLVFPSLRQLDVQAVTPLGQKSLRLTPSKRQVSW